MVLTRNYRSERISRISDCLNFNVMMYYYYVPPPLHHQTPYLYTVVGGLMSEKQITVLTPLIIGLSK